MPAPKILDLYIYSWVKKLPGIGYPIDDVRFTNLYNIADCSCVLRLQLINIIRIKLNVQVFQFRCVI